MGKHLVLVGGGHAHMLILNMGDGTGILWKKSMVINGRSAFLVKDFIDRRFIKKFQVSGEPRESNDVDAAGTYCSRAAYKKR